jgi:predicted phosphodiesterase
VEEVKEKIVPVLGDSHDDSTVEEVRKVLGGKKVDLLFIDGDHTQEGAERDFVKYKQFVREGGIVAFHDISSMITELWDHIINIYPLCWEIVHVAGRKNNGIGVVRMGRAIAYTAKFAKIDPRWYDDM